MAKKQFKAESKRLLGLMINSIYTNKEIFLRELISNASDALDKRYYEALTNPDHYINRGDLEIRIERNPEARTLVIEDNGIGMTDKEMEANLGTIARSGSLDFLSKMENKDNANIDIIGQFGVGFYSAFMVAKKITVESRSVADEEAHLWTSTGEDGYTIEPAERSEPGTRITLWMKDDTEEENYSKYIDETEIRTLIKKYSDYVRYPILMDVGIIERDPEDDEKTVTRTQEETLNSMVPLWKKNRSAITEEEYQEFYKANFGDWEDPQKYIHYSVEGNVSYTALRYIPSQTPSNFYNGDYESGLRLFSKGVFIMDNAKDLLPDEFRFVRGLIDSEDISLNISREILQQDRQVKALASSIEKKISGTLTDMLKNEREEYEKFFERFGMNFKMEIYRSYGMKADKLKDLLLYRTSKDRTWTTLAEYVERMKEGQNEIYYAAGKEINELEKLPVMAKLRDKGYEVLYFTDPVDEFAVTMMYEYEGKAFRSVTKGDLDLDTEEEKQEKARLTEDSKDMLEAMKAHLEGKVSAVRLSSRLKDDPVCLVAEDGISIEMERILSQDPTGRTMKAVKVLELNPDHPVFSRMKEMYSTDPASIDEYTDILYDQACIIEGLPIDDPAGFARRIADIMTKAY